jgi:hypothetical protein
MIRKALCTIGLLALMLTTALAETYGDKTKAVDPDKKTITIAVDGKDREFKVDDKVDVKAQVRAGKKLRLTPLRDGLKGIKVGDEVTLTTERKAGEEVVTKIVVLTPEKKGK